MKEETYHCLALSLIPGLGSRRLNSLIQACGSPSELLRLSPAQLARFQLAEETKAFISSGCALRAAEKALRQAREKGICILSIFDDRYPHRQKQIFDPPLVLYCLGNLTLLCRPSIAVVGSRRCSLYGKEMTEKISRELSSVGLCIVSGLARGIDSQAHIGALESGGPTVAVLGNGVDVIYPRENRRLYRRLCEGGWVISEFLCGTFPAPQNFPIRNRVISGLCYGTLITEASEFSGSLITARLALEQNRELWAVPGNITSLGSYGPNYLIKQGAKIVLDIQDVLEELPPYVLDLLTQQPTPSTPLRVESLTRAEEKVVKLLAPDTSMHFDQFLKTSTLRLSQLNEVLLQLEMKGLIRQLPGRQFSRKIC